MYLFTIMICSLYQGYLLGSAPVSLRMMMCPLGCIIIVQYNMTELFSLGCIFSPECYVQCMRTEFYLLISVSIKAMHSALGQVYSLSINVMLSA